MNSKKRRRGRCRHSPEKLSKGACLAQKTQGTTLEATQKRSGPWRPLQACTSQPFRPGAVCSGSWRLCPCQLPSQRFRLQMLADPPLSWRCGLGRLACHKRWPLRSFQPFRLAGCTYRTARPKQTQPYPHQQTPAQRGMVKKRTGAKGPVTSACGRGRTLSQSLLLMPSGGRCGTLGAPYHPVRAGCPKLSDSTFQPTGFPRHRPFRRAAH